MSFAWPWLLLLLPLPWLLGPRLGGAAERGALRLPFAFRLASRDTAGVSRSAGVRRRSVLGFWCLLVLAVARPQWVETAYKEEFSGRDFLMAIDVSASMASRDLTLDGHTITRLEAAQRLAASVLTSRPGDRAGLLVFGKDAWIHTPLTWDRSALLHAVQSLGVGLAGQETAIGDALTLATRRLAAAGAEARSVLLISDGANTAGAVTPQQAAWLAQREHVRVHTVLIAGEAVDGSALDELAAATGGLHARVLDRAVLADFLSRLDSVEPPVTRARDVRVAKELYPWPLGAALALWLAVRWRQRPAHRHRRWWAKGAS